jgi:hypothetical protein
MSVYRTANFPDSFAPKEEKDKKSYGLKVFQAILGSTYEYRTTLAKKLVENRKYAEGNQSLKPYLDELGIDGKNMYTNIRFRPLPVAQKFIRIVSDGYLKREEYPSATATSKHIKDRKEKKKQDAEFRMEEGQLIKEMSDKVGFPLEDPKAFTPKSPEELEIYMSLNDKEREELLLQDMINLALNDNNIEGLKSQVLKEQFIAQFHGYYNYIDDNGRLCVDLIQAEDIITDNSFKEDFKDSRYKGRFLRMYIGDIRRRFKLKPEDEKRLYDAAVSNSNRFNNPSGYLTWEEDYRFSGVRPYDNYTVEVAHIWYKTVKPTYISEGKDDYGRGTVDIKYNPPKEQPKKGTTVTVKYPEVSYEGYFTATGEMCISWGEERQVLKDGEDKDTLLSPFIFFMPENSGRMLPNSLMSTIIDPIGTMDLIILKIKQAIAKATPDDWQIDINGLLEVNLGNGIESPLTLESIHQQTGRLYYRGVNEAGQQVAPPARPMNSGLDVKLRGYIDIYNFALSNIRDYLGVNEFRDGSATNERTGFRFMQAQNEASNTATWFIYRAYLKSTEELIRQIAIRIWDALKNGNVNEGYLKYIGKENVEFLNRRKDITSSMYDIKFEMSMTDADKAILEQYIQTALANGQIEIPDALMLNRVKDPVIAEKLMTYVYNTRRETARKDKKQDQEANAQLQAQSGVAVEQERQKTFQMEAEVILAKEKAKAEGLRDGEMEKLAWKLIEMEATTGKPIPPQYLGIVQAVLTNRGLNVEQQTEEKTQELEAQEQALMQQGMVEEVQMAVQNGELTEEEAMQELQQAGVQI